MTNKLTWGLLAILSIFFGLYPGLFLNGNQKVGILNIKPDSLFSNPFWLISFYTHITLGGLALLTGWPQFSQKVRATRIRLHRALGKIYVVSVLVSAVAGINIAFYATGGWPTALGFMCLGITWFYTTLQAYRSIWLGNILAHGNWMTFSYACTFAAVTLRLWMPLLVPLFGNFMTAYTVVAWWCWLPNLTVAYFMTRQPKSVAKIR
ncbi:DUF2306 domain-containing protein [Chitinophaga rhizosphaerae]|uniref:DUF2306 domain-containing protein n=1 Tax=Chitinophaga rhizosphaerae TaxID=1864947 RepID=UPI000F800FAE|nr:DUF2306 domain-containing protein [Chitinophaga rhizosphaerae]